ncbi:MAG: hypothetical protein ACRD12_00555 [Acidimicrobiales bacterium]
MAWLLIAPALLALAAVPVTLVVVAARPSQATVRAAGLALLAFSLVVVILIIIGTAAA